MCIAYVYQPPPPRGDADPGCFAVGFSIEVGILAAAFRLGQWVHGRRAKQPLAERNQLLTIAVGALATVAFGAAVWLADRPTGGSGMAVGLIVIAFLIAAAASPWWVFRADDPSRRRDLDERGRR